MVFGTVVVGRARRPAVGLNGNCQKFIGSEPEASAQRLVQADGDLNLGFSEGSERIRIPDDVKIFVGNAIVVDAFTAIIMSGLSLTT